MAERSYTLVLLLAVGTAAAATYGVYHLVQGTKSGGRVATRAVVVASRDLPEGAPIDRLALAVRSWPAVAVPDSAFGAADSVIGRVTRVPIFAGEAIVSGRLAPPGTGPGLEVKIAPGKRAMGIKINDVAGISGLIQPNSRVDVLVTLKEDGTNNRQVAKVFMENMRVLSVGTKVQRGDDGKPIEANTATLEVTPEEAERLAVAANQGSIQLVLRGYGDPDSVKTSGARSNDVLAQLRSAPLASDDPPPKPAPPPVRRRVVLARPAPVPPPVVAPTLRPSRPDSLTVQIYRAGKVSQQKFEKSDSTTTHGSSAAHGSPATRADSVAASNHRAGMLP